LPGHSGFRQQWHRKSKKATLLRIKEGTVVAAKAKIIDSVAALLQSISTTLMTKKFSPFSME
jgi:hypothetical protein